jgi:hypothetical protein
MLTIPPEFLKYSKRTVLLFMKEYGLFFLALRVGTMADYPGKRFKP